MSSQHQTTTVNFHPESREEISQGSNYRLLGASCPEEQVAYSEASPHWLESAGYKRIHIPKIPKKFKPNSDTERLCLSVCPKDPLSLAYIRDHCIMIGADPDFSEPSRIMAKIIEIKLLNTGYVPGVYWMRFDPFAKSSSTSKSQPAAFQVFDWIFHNPNVKYYTDENEKIRMIASGIRYSVARAEDGVFLPEFDSRVRSLKGHDASMPLVTKLSYESLSFDVSPGRTELGLISSEQFRKNDYSPTFAML